MRRRHDIALRLPARRSLPNDRRNGRMSRAATYVRRLLETHPRNIYPACARMHRELMRPHG